MKYLLLTTLLFFSSNFLFAQVKITRLDGAGTGQQYLKLTNSTKQKILQNNKEDVLKYEGKHGPIVISNVFDPSLVSGTYRLKILDDNFQTQGWPTKWMLEDVNTGDQWTSNNTIDISNDQIITGRGFSINIQQVLIPGNNNAPNGFIGSQKTYANPGNEWLSGIQDDFIPNYTNFLRTGPLEEEAAKDPDQVFSNVVNGTWFPYKLVSWKPEPSTPGGSFITPVKPIIFSSGPPDNLKELNNVDIFFTPDKSKWSRCVVVNTFSPYYEQDSIPNPGSLPFSIRNDASLDKDGNPQSSTGFSWFPGYAIDVGSGERLNIFFGENTYFNSTSTGIGTANDLGLSTSNGMDMIWNPSSTTVEPIPPSTVFSGSLTELPLGGQHFVYVTNELYDECAQLGLQLNGSAFDQLNAWAEVMWTTIPVLTPGSTLLSMADGLIPNEVEIQLRVNNPYSPKLATGFNNSYPLYQFTLNSATVGTNDWEESSSLRLGNNPLSISAGGFSTLFNIPKGTTITLVDVKGQVLKSWETNVKEDIRLYPDKLEIFSPGQFYIHLQRNTGESILKKWMVLE